MSAFSATSVWTHRLAALPDAITASAFASLWFAPLWLGPRAISNALLTMLVEFVLVHASGMLGGLLESRSHSRRAQVLALLGFGFLYSAFIGAFALTFFEWWPVLVFAWLLVGKLQDLFGASPADPAHRQRRQTMWAAQVVAYLAAVFITLLLPVPRFGISEAVQPQLGLTGSGLWVGQPQTVVVAGVLYFGLLAWLKWKGSTGVIVK
jgi:hypothetical protein